MVPRRARLNQGQLGLRNDSELGSAYSHYSLMVSNFVEAYRMYLSYLHRELAGRKEVEIGTHRKEGTPADAAPGAFTTPTTDVNMYGSG